jgi:hypothetical protein
VIRTLIVAALVALPSAALAQPAPSPAPSPTPVPDICSGGLSAVVSRPTQTTSACVVSRNQILLETGYQSQTVDSAGGSFTFSTVPNATIRIGTALRNVEFQVIPPTSIRSAGISAAGDAGAGLKWQIASTPAVAYGVNVIATAPTGSDPARSPNGLGSSNASTYTYNANVQGSLGKVFGYGATFSVGSLASAGTRYTSVIPSLDVTMSLPASWTLAAEAFRVSNGEGPATPSHTWFDVAAEKGVGNVQFDLSYGLSNRVVPVPGAPGVRHSYVGFGLSVLR